MKKNQAILLNTTKRFDDENRSQQVLRQTGHFIDKEIYTPPKNQMHILEPISYTTTSSNGTRRYTNNNETTQSRTSIKKTPTLDGHERTTRKTPR